MQAAVNLLAKVSGINETKLAYYLDMYYQLRDAYEAAKAEELLDVSLPAMPTVALHSAEADEQQTPEPCEPPPGCL